MLACASETICMMDYKVGHLSLDINCSSKLTVFHELRFRKAVCFSEQIMSADKYQVYFCVNPPLGKKMATDTITHNSQRTNLTTFIKP